MLQLDHGTIVHNRYRILRPIGKGGMGAVYEAIDLRLHNVVAVKQMTATGAEADQAFAQEAQLLASLRHSGLPAVTDYFIESGSRFLVMQHIDGDDLEQLCVRNGRRCNSADVLLWADALLHVLSFLHNQHPPIVHRDVKPANIKLTPRGEIVLVDFGLAKGGHVAATQLTTQQRERSIYGFTPNYAPPEQHDGSGTDARSDVYSVGATIYHLLTGVAPPAANIRAAVIANGGHDPLRAAHTVNSDVAADVSAIVAKALHLDAAQRFQDAYEMRQALAAVRDTSIQPRRAPRTDHQHRRVDAAMPSEAQIGRQVDLLVQVRFATSALLGREDWPSRRVPEKIEQASETFELAYPIDPRTRRELPARLRVKIVAPDFSIDSTPECLIEVPPDTFSKRLVFLLTPQRPGLCRVNVELYSMEAVHLGTVPIEAEAVQAASSNPVWRVAQLVLGIATHEARVDVRTHDKVASGPSSGSAVQPDGPVDGFAADEVHEAHAEVVSHQRIDEGTSRPPRRTSSNRLSRWITFGTPLAVLFVALVVMQRTWFMPDAREMVEPEVVATPPPPAESPDPLPAPAITPANPVARPSTVVSGFASVPRRPGESEEEWRRRNAQLLQDYTTAVKYFDAGDNVTALKLFGAIAEREPGYRDVAAYVRNAEQRLDQERQQVVLEALGLQLEGQRSFTQGNLAQAAATLSQASASLERARVLQASDVEKHIAENLERRRAVGQAALNRARALANQKKYAEARELLQLIVNLLPAGDPTRTQADDDLRRLAQ